MLCVRMVIEIVFSLTCNDVLLIASLNDIWSRLVLRSTTNRLRRGDIVSNVKV